MSCGNLTLDKLLKLRDDRTTIFWVQDERQKATCEALLRKHEYPQPWVVRTNQFIEPGRVYKIDPPAFRR